MFIASQGQWCPVMERQMPNVPDVVARAMASRASAGLKLTFDVQDRKEPFVCYPKDEVQKAKWLATAAKRGWVLIP
jgi:hypothetical protein